MSPLCAWWQGGIIMTPERALCSGHTAPCTTVRASRPDSNTGLTSPFQGSLMAMTLRLKPDLSAEAQAYADALGISVNALIVVALRDYLDQRGRVPPLPPAAAEPAPARVRQAVPSHTARGLFPALKLPGPEEAAPKLSVPAVGVYGPCPCGSGQKWKFCHGKPVN
jgi:hypothetical protein